MAVVDDAVGRLLRELHEHPKMRSDQSKQLHAGFGIEQLSSHEGLRRDGSFLRGDAGTKTGGKMRVVAK